MWRYPTCYFPPNSCIKFIGCKGVCAYYVEGHDIYCLSFLRRQVPLGREFLSLLVLLKPQHLAWDVCYKHPISK